MNLWNTLWNLIQPLRPAFSRTQAFLWFTVAVAGLSARKDSAGVTSIIRSLGLLPKYYYNLLGMFHSDAVQIPTLSRLWQKTVRKTLKCFLYRTNGRIVLLADGIKVAKAGKKMPGVKLLHQESESNSKPEYIFGHSCQVLAILAGMMSTFFAIPLSCGIHEGVVFSNRDKRTLIDKLIQQISTLAIDEPIYLVADAYYGARSLIRAMLADGHHLVVALKSNAVAYEQAISSENKGRGAKKKYGKKIYLRSLLSFPDMMTAVSSPVYGDETTTISFRSQDLLWRRAGVMVRIVAVDYPGRGRKLLLSTDLSLSPIDIIRIYGLRFKIEVSFKQAIHTIGTYAYHFWMAAMKPLKRKSGNQYLHRETDAYRKMIVRKLHAYHVHIMIGIIVQGIAQIIAITKPETVWSEFGSWLRTIRPETLPSEMVIQEALRNTLPEFIADSKKEAILAKFIREKIDFSRAEGIKLVA